MDQPQQFNLHQRINREFSRMVVDQFRSLEKLERKSARFANHLHYTLHCKHHGIVPQSLRIKTSVKGPNAARIIHNTQSALMNERIRQINATISTTKRNISDVDECLFTSLPVDVYKEVKSFVTQKRIKERWVVNKSDRTLSESELSVLQKGLNFSVVPNSIPTAEFVTGIGTACNMLGSNSGTAIQLRSDCVRILKDCKLPKSNITKEERSALRDLRSDDTILILPADKGRATVILNKDTYLEKSQELLSD